MSLRLPTEARNRREFILAVANKLCGEITAFSGKVVEQYKTGSNYPLPVVVCAVGAERFSGESDEDMTAWRIEGISPVEILVRYKKAGNDATADTGFELSSAYTDAIERKFRAYALSLQGTSGTATDKGITIDTYGSGGYKLTITAVHYPNNYPVQMEGEADINWINLTFEFHFTQYFS